MHVPEGLPSARWAACAGVGQEMLAARVSLLASTASGLQTLGQGLVRAIWTNDEALSTRISRHVAHYTGQAELAQAIQDGLEAHRAGDDDTTGPQSLTILRRHRDHSAACGQDARAQLFGDLVNQVTNDH